MIFIGDVYSVNDAIKSNITNDEWENENWKKTDLSSRLPWGSSETPELSGLDVNVAGIHGSGSKYKAEELRTNINEFRAYLLVHGLVHNAGVNGHPDETSSDLDMKSEDALLITSGAYVTYGVGNIRPDNRDIRPKQRTLSEIASPAGNSRVADILESHFNPDCNEKATDNYEKNKAKKNP